MKIGTGVVCKTWADHRWSEPRLLDVGRDPTRGYYQRMVTRCGACDKRIIETRWIGHERRPVVFEEGASV